MEYTIFQAAGEAVKEVARAKEKHGPANFNSIHEGFAVLNEEVDELWDEVKVSKPDKEKLYHEAIQVAAMALRFASELNETVNFKNK